MAKTIVQIQQMITDKYDVREIINELTDYIQANPSSPGGGGVQSVTGDLVGGTAEDPIINLPNPLPAVDGSQLTNLPSSGGVQSVSGDLVDNNDPLNPIINTPTPFFGDADGDIAVDKSDGGEFSITSNGTASFMFQSAFLTLQENSATLEADVQNQFEINPGSAIIELNNDGGYEVARFYKDAPIADDTAAAAAGIPIGVMYFTAGGDVKIRMA